MILGIDSTGEVYPCYPQERTGSAVLIEGGGGLKDLPTAVQIDETPGAERIVAVLCDGTFTTAELSRSLAAAKPGAEGRLPTLRQGCLQQEILLQKATGEPQ